MHGHTTRERPKTTFVGVLRSDLGLRETRDIAALMGDAHRWRELVHGSREFYPPNELTTPL